MLRLRASATALALLVLVGCAAEMPVATPAPAPTPPDWAMFRGNPQHAGVATSSIPLTLPLEPNWEFHKSTRGAGVTSSPAVWQGILFLGCDDGKLYALEVKTGKKLWEFRTGGNNVSSPAVCEGMVFFGCDDEKFYALEARTGGILGV